MFLNQSGDIVPMLLCLNNQLGEDDSVLTLLFDPTCQSDMIWSDLLEFKVQSY